MCGAGDLEKLGKLALLFVRDKLYAPRMDCTVPCTQGDVIGSEGFRECVRAP